MSLNNINEQKSINEFTLDITQKTKLFFKSFNELTKDNLETYLDCINLLDIWNTKEEKEFLWNSFYKYNINGKVIESSVLKGLNEILSWNEQMNSIIPLEDKNEDYSTDGISIIRLSYNKKQSSSIIKSSINSSSTEINKDNLSIKIDINNLEKFIEETDIKELKKIKNIMLLLNDSLNISLDSNNNSNPIIIKLNQIIDLFSNYQCLKIPTEHIKNYLSNISEYSLSEKIKIKNDEFIINNDLYKLSIKLISNKIKKYEKESIYNEEIDSININDGILFPDIGENKNKVENKVLISIKIIIDLESEFKEYIQIFKEIEKSLKNCNENIINDFKNLLSLKNEGILENKASLDKISDKDDDEDEIKINIENNIFSINNKSKELDIFIKETENIIEQKEIINKNLNGLINKLIKDKLNLEKEKNDLISKKAEDDNITDKQFNIVDEKLNKLTEEKNILEKKVKELLDEIEKNKLLYKNSQSLLKEMDKEYNIKIKELEEIYKENNLLKIENQKIKNDYDSLLNEIITINNNKEIEFKEYDKRIIINAKNNIEKKLKLDENQKNICYLNHGDLLEYAINLYDKYNSQEKKLEENNQLLKEKNKKINQLENDLDLYREKTSDLSRQIKELKNENNNNKDKNNINSKKSGFTLEELGISRSNVFFNENNNLTNKNSNELYLTNNNKETPRISNNNNNLFAPPCFWDNEKETEGKNLTNTNKPEKENEIKNYDNTNDNNNLISNEKKEQNNKDENYDNKFFSNTPKGDIKENNSNKNEENLIEIFKNIVDDRPSNPFRINNNSNISNNSNNIYFNNFERESNPYRNNNNEENNPYKGNSILNYSNKYNDNTFNLIQNDNLNINNEIIKNNDKQIVNFDNKEKSLSQNNENITQGNSLLNQNLPLYIDKSLSLPEMNEIFKKNHENKLNIEYFDYLHLFNNGKIRQILIKIGDYCLSNEIFSDIVYLLDEYDQIYKYILFITKKCIYIIESDTYKIKYTFVRNILLRFTIANNNCNIIVFHFNIGNDLVIMTLRRPELIYYFLKIKDNDNNEQLELKFKYADEFNVKKDGRYYTQKIKSSMNSIAFNFQTAIKLGYLTKINEGYIFNQYHEKLVVLTDFGLFYFDNPTVNPKKLIPIIGSDIVPLKNKFNDRQYAFEIRTINKNKIVFGTEDKEEYEDWIKIFNEVKEKYEKRKIDI